MMQTENTVGIHDREPVGVRQCHDTLLTRSRDRQRSQTMKGGDASGEGSTPKCTESGK